jgi:hypothetical protein
MSLAIVLLALIITLIQGNFSLLNLINNSFLLSLPLLMIGGFLYVYEGGFFNGIAYSYRRLRRSTKMGKYVAQFDNLDEQPVVPKSFSVTKPMIFSGLLIFSLTLIAAYLIR